MDAATAWAAAATLLAVAFACCTYERWLRRRRRHELAWSAALGLFGLGALAFWAATAVGWSPWLFRAFYLLGGILTVPVLALGTLYLLGGRRVGDRAAAAVALLGAYATGVVTTAPLRAPLQARHLNEGRTVFGPLPRILAAVGSGVAALIVIAGALWSAWAVWRAGRRGVAPAASGRLALANTLIALGTFAISFKRPFVSLSGSDESGFALALAVGLAIIFAGFLLATVPAATTAAVTSRAAPGARPSRPALRAVGRGTRPSSGTCSGQAGPRRTG